MTYRSSPATSRDLERALRDEQRDHRRTRLLLLVVAASALAAFVSGGLLRAEVAELTDSLYWANRRGDYWHARATEVRPWRDWVRPAIERVKP